MSLFLPLIKITFASPLVSCNFHFKDEHFSDEIVLQIRRMESSSTVWEWMALDRWCGFNGISEHRSGRGLVRAFEARPLHLRGTRFCKYISTHWILYYFSTNEKKVITLNLPRTENWSMICKINHNQLKLNHFITCRVDFLIGYYHKCRTYVCVAAIHVRIPYQLYQQIIFNNNCLNWNFSLVL